MTIIWAGVTVGRIKFRKIDWRCDCGRNNISTDPDHFNRTVTCWSCGRRYEIEFNAIHQDAITS